jgi:hypothetical protein
VFSSGAEIGLHRDGCCTMKMVIKQKQLPQSTSYLNN